MASARTCPTCQTAVHVASRFCDKCGQPLGEPDPPRTSAGPSTADPLLTVGPYQAIRAIGEGGFGRVFLATDTRIDRPVVLKIARAGAGAAKAFEREQAATRKLVHPNIVRTLDAGTLDKGAAYLVFEWVDGPSLEAVLEERGRLNLLDALAISEAITDALVAAHATGVIHRDLKPTNVLIPSAADGPAFREAKLTDFGVIGTLERNSGQTITGQVFGTPQFMSPEQLQGERQSPATDIYGLGVLLYTMLYGDPPFVADNLPQLAYNVLERPVEFPNSPRVPSMVRSFLLRCLQKTPADRFGSAVETLEQLRRLHRRSSGKTRPAAPPSPRRTKTVPAESSIESKVAGEAAMTPAAQPRLIPPERKTMAQPAGRSAARRAGSRHVGLLWMLIALAAIAGAGGLWLWMGWTGSTPAGGLSLEVVNGIAIGLLLVAAGVSLGVGLRRWLRRFRTRIADEAADVLVGAGTRSSLTQSLALDVQALIARCREIDERFLAKSLAIMVREFEVATEAGGRRAALMDAVTIVDKLRDRLTPWYVRHEKLVALFASLIGIIGGAVKVADTIAKLR